MSLSIIGYAIGKGGLDSIKGIYLLYNLDATQRRVHQERLQFQELRQMKNPPSPSHRHGGTKEEPRLLTRVLQCCTLNGLVFGLSIVIFNQLLLPCLQVVLRLMLGDTSDANNFWYWLHLILKTTFDSLWVLPLFLLSRIVNALWFQDISDLAYRYSVGRAKGLPSLSTFIADILFSVIIQALFLVQALLLSMIPLWGVADLLYIFHMCLLYSLYSFEYKWVQMGWPLHQRLYFIESNWPYFFGFGLPLTLLTWWPGSSFFINGCLFAIFFPLFIISGNEADPVVLRDHRGIQLFSVVVAISNALFSKTWSFGSQKQRPRTTLTPSASQQPKVNRR